MGLNANQTKSLSTIRRINTNNGLNINRDVLIPSPTDLNQQINNTVNQPQNRVQDSYNVFK